MEAVTFTSGLEVCGAFTFGFAFLITLNTQAEEVKFYM